MEQISYNYKAYVKKAFSYITRALERGDNLQAISKGLRSLVNSYKGLNRNERFRLYSVAYTTTRAARSSDNWQEYLSLRKSFDAVLGSARKVKASSELRKKKQDTRAHLQSGESVFYLCSKHSNPAKDHAEYQGRIYVDRFWREKVSGRMYYAVLSYIKNHQIKTVQEIMGPPVYLITRPYCKHYFIPLDTEAVLHTSLKKLVENEGIKRDKPYTTTDYYNIREKVYTKMNRITPCSEFQDKTKRRG